MSLKPGVPIVRFPPTTSSCVNSIILDIPSVSVPVLSRNSLDQLRGSIFPATRSWQGLQYEYSLNKAFLSSKKKHKNKKRKLDDSEENKLDIVGKSVGLLAYFNTFFLRKMYCTCI